MCNLEFLLGVSSSVNFELPSSLLTQSWQLVCWVLLETQAAWGSRKSPDILTHAHVPGTVLDTGLEQGQGGCGLPSGGFF